MNTLHLRSEIPGDERLLLQTVRRTVLENIIHSEIRLPIWIFGLLVGSLLISAWHIFAHIIENDSVFFFKALVTEFELSLDYVSDVATQSVHYIPFNWLAVFLANGAVLFVLVRYVRDVKGLFHK